MNASKSPSVLDLGSRLELFVEDSLIDRLSGNASLRLHQPVPRDETFVTDRPWEGNMCGYVTIFQDRDKYRMYYKAEAIGVAMVGRESTHLAIGYAESEDGLSWTRPNLGIIDYQGSKENNLVWSGETELLEGSHGFVPFKDTNPECSPDAKYKAVGTDLHCKLGLLGLKSADGLHWSLIRKEPLLVDADFDSQNLVFWDDVRQEYRAYVRRFHDEGFRGIMTATSEDFLNWTKLEWLNYPGSPHEQLYTNQITPYYRAPHIFVGFPSRYVERPWSPSIEALPELKHRKMRSSMSERYGSAVTDGLFMASRDGITYKRWDEAFIRPGLRTEGSWTYGDCYQCWGLIETPSSLPGAPNEISFYSTEHYWREPATIFRRHTLRIDGFVSLHAPLGGGALVTNPVTFSGDSLRLNVSTSAGGSARVEMQNADGMAIPGFALADCYEIIGDTLDYEVQWKNRPCLKELAGKPIRLKFELRDADIYSFAFREGG